MGTGLKDGDIRKLKYRVCRSWKAIRRILMKVFIKFLNRIGYIFVLISLILVSCDISGPSGTAERSGILQIITPTDLDPEIISLQVIGQGPSGRSFDFSFPVSAAPISIPNLLAGPWTIFVFGLNASSEQVLAGQANTVIEVGESNEITLTLYLLGGTGTLVVEFNWPVGILSNPVVTASISQYIDGDVFDDPIELLPFTYSVSEGIATYRYEGTHDAGYYLIDTQVDDDDGTPWADSDGLLIASGNETPVTIDLETGSVDIQIIIAQPDPLSVTLTTDTVSPLPLGTDMTVTGSVTGGSLPYTYRWYMNGELLTGETGASVILGSTLAAGRYRLTLIASDGDVLGSDGIVFDVMP
jgi:hypothetical protein